MRVIFVGLHNKPGKRPLCISTKSGKLISRIINEGALKNYLKTNLFDVEYFPTERDEQVNLAFDWLKRVEPQEDDVLVLLGATVHNATPPNSSKELKIAHPASKRSHVAMNEYVSQTIERILSLLNTNHQQ
jgi:hypothetical protein